MERQLRMYGLWAGALTFLVALLPFPALSPTQAVAAAVVATGCLLITRTLLEFHSAPRLVRAVGAARPIGLFTCDSGRRRITVAAQPVCPRAPGVV